MSEIKRSKDYPGVYSRDGGKTWAYRAQFGDIHGRWGVHGSGFRTMKDAWQARNLAASEAEAQRGRQVRIDPSILVGEYLDHWLHGHAGTLRPTSARVYRFAIRDIKRHHIAAIQLRSLTEADVRWFIGELRQRPISYNTMMIRVRVLRTALGSAHNSGLIRSNPAAGIKVSRTTEKFVPQTWDAATARRFLAHRQATGDPLAPVWRLAVVTGMRRGELLGLRWEDIHFEGRYLNVRRQRTTSGGVTFEGPPKTDSSDAKVYLDPETCAALAAMPRPSAYVATDRDGQPCRPDLFFRLFRRASAAAGVPAIRFHDLRHTAATLMAEAGVLLAVAQGRLRHSSPQMTELYTHAQAGPLRLAGDLMGTILSSDEDDDGEAGQLVAV